MRMDIIPTDVRNSLGSWTSSLSDGRCCAGQQGNNDIARSPELVVYVAVRYNRPCTRIPRINMTRGLMLRSRILLRRRWRADVNTCGQSAPKSLNVLTGHLRALRSPLTVLGLDTGLRG